MNDRPQAIASRGGSVTAGSKRDAQRALESTPTEAADAWRICTTHRPSHEPCRATSPKERSRAAAFDGVTGPSVVRLDAADDVPAALRSRSRWVPLPTDLRPSDSSAATVPTVPVSGASRRGPMGRQPRSAPRNLRPSWRRGDQSPREMIRNYPRSPRLSSTSFKAAG